MKFAKANLTSPTLLATPFAALVYLFYRARRLRMIHVKTHQTKIHKAELQGTKLHCKFHLQHICKPCGMIHLRIYYIN